MKRFVTLVLLLACLSTTVALAQGPYGREYNLRTLDTRVAELLVWEMCEKYGQSAEQCQVQVAQGRSMYVIAPKEIHSRITRMLVERDSEPSRSQGFKIALVRAASGKPMKGIMQPDILRAVDAVRELFPGKLFEIVDMGVLRTTDEGSMRLGSAESRTIYDVWLRYRSAVTRMDSRELTVELRLNQPQSDGGEQTVLSSVLTVPVGDPVVAGSSRMSNGEDTLLVVLTAVDDPPSR